jgi:uncharacterized membrane protein YbhN (UPF0104 family)
LRKGLIQTLKFFAFFIVGVFLLWIAFRNVEYQRLIEGLKEADYSWVLLSLLFAFLAYLSRARRWVLLIHPLGFRPSLSNTFFSLMAGYLANLALPRIGEITRCVALGKKEKVPVDQLIGTVVIERAIDFFSLLLIMFILIIIKGDEITGYLKESIFVPLQQKVFAMFGFTWIIWAIIIVTSVLFILLLIRYRKKLRTIRFVDKIFTVIKGVINGMKTPGDGIFLLVIGGIAMSAPVQSGLGAYHYFISRAIAFIGGVHIEDGLIYAFITHESQMLFVIIIGAISFFMIFRKNHEEKKT